MRIPVFKESLRFLGLIVFFTFGLLWSPQIAIHSTWDFTLMQMLTVMSGLGLCMVVLVWGLRIRDRKFEAEIDNSSEGN